MKRIVSLYIVLIILTLSTSIPTASFARKNLQNVLIVYSTEDPYCMEVLKNTEIVLEKNDIYFTKFNLSSNYTLPALDNFPIIAIATETIYYLPIGPQTDLKNYVKNGGRVVQLLRGYSQDVVEIYGITNTTTPEIIEQVGGIEFITDFIPGVKGLKIPPKDCENVSYEISLNQDARIIARAYNGLPLAWSYVYGNGETIFWNATLLSDKAYRGLIIGSITSLLPISARKIIGAGLVYIDDMPSPSWKTKLEPIKSEYDITDTEYYFKVMLPDLIDLGKRYNIKYTTATVFSYNNITKPPFSFFEWDNTTLLNEDGSKINVPEQTFKILNEEKAEVGFHGYNHIPFTLAEWHNQANMKKAVESAREKWFSLSSTAPRVYVPPMNVNDREGFDAVMDVFPEISIYASLYTGYFDEGCDREFGIEPWNERIVSIPRVTSGYNLSDYDKITALSAIESFGVWTHFLHPDDVFSTPINYPLAEPEWIRNPESLPWKGEKTGNNGLFYKFEKVVDKIESLYPWLSFKTALEAKDDILHYDDSGSSVDVYNDFINFNTFHEATYIVELPSILTLEKDENLTILSNKIFGNKRKMVIRVKNGCKVYFKAS